MKRNTTSYLFEAFSMAIYTLLVWWLIKYKDMPIDYIWHMLCGWYSGLLISSVIANLRKGDE